MIVPAYNEAATIIDNVRALTQLEYPEYRILVVNDGSKDDTLDRLKREISLRESVAPRLAELETEEIRGFYYSEDYPNVAVLDKANGGKADAINAGVNAARDPLVCVVDADSIMERDSLLKVVRPFVEDENVVAVGGVIRVANGCRVDRGRLLEVGLSKKWIARFQVVEYLRAFLFGRSGFDVVNGVMIISGAFSVFRKDLVEEIGGYKRGSIGEDMEIVVRMHRLVRKRNPKARVTFVPDPVCWTEAPEDWGSLRRRRTRWQKGLFEGVLDHRRLFLNPRYGFLGMLAFPFFAVFELFGPLVEALGYVVFVVALALGALSAEFAVAFLAAAFLFGVCLSTLAVILEELTYRRYPKPSHLGGLIIAAFVENFGYRQINAFWRLSGLFGFVFGKRAWGKIERVGFGAK